MLKGINPMLSPELLKTLCEMGHSDTIVIADGNFPAETMGKNGKVIRMDGHGVPEILEAILEVFPLDQYIEKPVSLMERVPGDNADVSIWKTYEKLIEQNEEEEPRSLISWNDLLFMRKQRKLMPSLQPQKQVNTQM